MSLFTGKGDNGTTKTFGCDQRISKSSLVAEALGNLDELNSFLGIVKIKAKESGFKILDSDFFEIIEQIQQDLFIIQAELAGADKHLNAEKIKLAEEIINTAEKEMPPIKSFFISGGTELAAKFDFARTLARRAERRVVGANDEGKIKLGEFTLPYLNRLSSVLYALARLSNHKSGINESAPSYN